MIRLRPESAAAITLGDAHRGTLALRIPGGLSGEVILFRLLEIAMMRAGER